MAAAAFASIDDYINAQPEAVRPTLEAIRRTIKEVVPGAEEGISYGLPAFRYEGRYLLYFGAAKRHCALYGSGLGTVRFPHAEPLPFDQIRELVAKRAEENAALARERPRRR